MAHYEIDSFISKFRYLWSAGFKASLTLESSHGEATVTLKAGLGFPLPPPQSRFDQKRGPSYWRRQDRRRKARENLQKAEEASIDLFKSSNITEKVVEKSEIYETSSAEKADSKEDDENDTNDDLANKNDGETFNCDICDFESNWSNGLSIHMSRKHGTIEQLDGINETTEEVVDEKYFESEHYWKTGRIGTIFQTFLDVNLIIESSNLSEDDKKMEKAKALDARKEAFGKEYAWYPPWKIR